MCQCSTHKESNICWTASESDERSWLVKQPCLIRMDTVSNYEQDFCWIYVNFQVDTVAYKPGLHFKEY